MSRVFVAFLVGVALLAAGAAGAGAVVSASTGGPTASFWRYRPDQRVIATRPAVLAASARHRQAIGAARLRRLRGGRVRLNFAIAYPQDGRRGGTGWVRVKVYGSPRRLRVLTTLGRGVRAVHGGTVRVSIVIKGTGGRALSVALRVGQRRALKMVTIESWHGRELDGDPGIDLSVGVTRIAAEATAAPHVAVAAASPIGGTSGTIAVANTSTADYDLVSAAPISCMYSNGQNDSDLTSFNGLKLPPSGVASYSVQDNASTASSPVDGYSWDATQPGYGHGSTVITPAYVDATIYSSELAGFLYNANSYYEQSQLGADRYLPNTFLEAYAQLPYNGDSCYDENTSLFGIGVDAYVTGDSGPTGAHAASVFKMSSGPTITEVASLDHELVQQLSNFGGATGLGTDVGTGASANDIQIYDLGPSPGSCNAQGGQDWMQCVFPPGTSAEQVPLSSITFPGTHDSGTPNLASSSDWILQQPTPTPATDVCSTPSFFFNVAANDVYRAATSQPFVIRQQLDLGIRYLDLRVAYDPGGGDDPGGTWRIVHTMLAQDSAETIAQTIADWAAAHPDEVLVADFNHVCPPADGDTSQLIDALTTPGPSGESLCDVAYVTPQAASALPQTTLATVRGAGKNVIVLLDGNQTYDIPSGCGFYPFIDETTNNASAGSPGDVAENHLWPQNPGPGKDACTVSSSNAPNAAAIQAYPLSDLSPGIGMAPTLTEYRTASPVPFTQTQTQYTPDTTTEIEALGDCSNLLGYESLAVADYRPAILSAWGNLANFVIGDDVSYDYVNELIAANNATARTARPVAIH